MTSSSLAKAKKAFERFSLSRFAADGLPANHVKSAKNRGSVQRRIISQHLDKLSNEGSVPGALTISLPVASIKQLLPSLDTDAGTIELSDVMALIQRNMRGTEFYANGNPILNSLAIRSQVQQIMAGFKPVGPSVTNPSAPMGETK